MGAIDGANQSIWVATAPPAAYPALQGDVEVDVAIVGGGITGLSTATMLLGEGASVAVIEARRIASGTTGYTTAKLTSLHGLNYASIVEDHGMENALLYAEASQAGIEKVAELIEQGGIDCDFERMPAFTYTEDDRRVSDIEREVQTAQSLGLPAAFETETDLPYRIAGAVRFDDQAVFHPGKYCQGLAGLIDRQGGRIFEMTRVTEIDSGDPCTVVTATGRIKAQHVVQATLLPMHDPAGFFARASPSRSYAIAVQTPEPVPEGMYLSADTPTRSIRPHRDGDDTFLLFGGEGHKVGQDSNTRQRYEALEQWARQTFHANSIRFRWSAQDYIPADGVPYIGKLYPGADQMWVATGFKKWGMTTGTVAGMILTDLIGGKENHWAPAFEATRLKLGASAKKLLQENADAAKRFASDHFQTASAPDVQTLSEGEGAIVRAGDETVAAYRDTGGKLHAASSTCTHLGCVVAFNAAERSWDCPCHGSRFDLDGRVLQGPAVDDLPKMKLED